MRPAPILLLLVCWGSLGLPSAAQVVNLQVTDTSAPDSPIRISGSVIVAASIGTSPLCLSIHLTRCTINSEQLDIVFANVSDQPIIAFIASLEVYAPNLNGGGDEYRSDHIFGNPLEPAESEPWRDGARTRVSPARDDIQPTSPKAEEHVVFVQFADGATFGDKSAAESLLRDRQESLESLAHLQEIYARQGQEAFSKALQESGAGGMLGIAQMEKQAGPAQTFARIGRILANAKQHMAAMSSQPVR